MMMIYESCIYFGRRGRYQTATFVPYMACISRELRIPVASARALLLKEVFVTHLNGERQRVDDGSLFVSSVYLRPGSSLQVLFERRDRRFTRPMRIELGVEAIGEYGGAVTINRSSSQQDPNITAFAVTVKKDA
jgi:hypothetical protein